MRAIIFFIILYSISSYAEETQIDTLQWWCIKCRKFVSHEEMMKKYDKDGDGKLSKDEKLPMQDESKKRKQK